MLIVEYTCIAIIPNISRSKGSVEARSLRFVMEEHQRRMGWVESM
jgi:hypothetical protein